ncbi:uncharacterized protein LOC123384588 isoform X1 [Felis catus]|uniref:uncharacterized protein LOC123384588 isoform X1 n=1 Tax=Felis catus TaxID=9685 RepID=UPI001D198D90|nr:uncharacterized protein LOC123384588 isoform X1 [Felis catus]
MDDLLRDWCEGPVAETYLCFPKPCPLSFQGLGRLEESLKSEEKGPSEGSLMDAYWRPLETSPPAVMTHLGGPLPAWAKVFSPPASAFLCLMSTDAGKVGNKGLQRATPSGTPLREAGSSGGTTGEGEHGNSGKQGAQIPPCFTCGSNGCGCALEHGMTDGSSVNARETQKPWGPGAWAILLTGLERVFILRMGTLFCIPRP